MHLWYIVFCDLLLKKQFMFPLASHIFDACWMRDPLSAKYKVQARVSTTSEVFQIPRVTNNLPSSCRHLLYAFTKSIRTTCIVDTYV